MITRSHPLLTCLLLLTLGSAAFAQTVPATQKWETRDTKGRGVAVPAGNTTVLLFLRPGQGQSADAMKLIGPMLKDRKDVQVVGVVSGDDAATGAAELEKSGFAYPIVADAAYDASGRFSVRVWPTVVVVGSKGEEPVRLPGLPVSLANDLAAHLDFAAGKLDKAGLAKALANREVVTDSEDEKAARHAEVAQRMAVQGLSTQAAAEVARALELKPKSGKLIGSLARTTLILGDVKSAESLLAKLNANELPPNEMNLLKGWAAIQGDRWAEAKQFLLEATKLNPDPAEALYLLGRVYEHEGDAAKAAEAYRKAFERTEEGKGMSGR